MSKAILVLDMPNSCNKCPCFCGHYSDMCCMALNNRTINYPYPKDFRQRWCPLKELPEETHNNEYMDEYCDGYDDGWNSLRKKILCEDEERDFDKISASEVEKLESEVIKELSNLVKAIRDEDKTLIIVSNEVGMSVVPSYRLGRIFSDISGKANQVLASLSDEVYVAISGLPLRLK